MRELTYESGMQSYTVNGVENAFTANLTEGSFIERLCNAVAELQKMHESLNVREDAGVSDMLTMISDYDKMYVQPLTVFLALVHPRRSLVLSLRLHLAHIRPFG